MKVKSVLIFMMLVTVFISGGATAGQQLRQSNVNAHPELKQQPQESILNDSLFVIGMTKEQVIATLGRPYDINRTVGSWGLREQWIYKVYDPKGYPTCSFVPTKYLYFENGKLTGWQRL